MAEEAKLRIRGIYSTALTEIFLRHGFTIVSPSAAIRERFAIAFAQGEEEVAIYDREDRQGVVVEGEREKVAQVVEVLKSVLPEAIFRSLAQLPQSLADYEGRRITWAELAKLGRASCEVEFPATAKTPLDEIRARIIPTLPSHHHLKVIDSERVDSVEAEFSGSVETLAEMADRLRKELIYYSYRLGRTIPICHVKLDGTVLGLGGRIRGFQPGKALEVERKFRGKGHYDGLRISKEEGNWGVVELEEGSWVSRRSYFALGGEAKGEMYNINTPPEFYPDYVRYVDLEVDVVRWPDGSTRMIDREHLERAAAEGVVTSQLAEKALAVAEQLEQDLKGAPD